MEFIIGLVTAIVLTVTVLKLTLYMEYRLLLSIIMLLSIFHGLDAKIMQILLMVSIRQCSKR